MEYINRRGETYLAFQGKTKTGKPKYFASKKPKSDKAERAESLPAEFEFYEKPTNATVTIRRRRVSPITVAERNLLERLCLECAECTCQVAIEGNYLVVFTAPILRSGDSIFGEFPNFAAAIGRSQNLNPELRFKLVDKQQRLFAADRYCYRSAFDGWMQLHRPPGQLESMARSLLPHLGQESFFELL